MRWIGRLLLWVVAFAGLLAVLSIAPVVYTEVACRGDGTPAPYTAQLAPEHQRAETRTLLTYPEWHIVHAYDDYAQTIRNGDPHEFGYVSAIMDFWGTLCTLSTEAASLGEVTGDTKLTIYTIGASFTGELILKAVYEETLGRLVAMLRGEERAPLDDLSAEQATQYAEFLQQTPWYRWNFTEDAAALSAAQTEVWRDRERALALGLEYRAKALYAEVIAAAVSEIGADELTLRSIVTGIPEESLTAIEGVTIIGTEAGQSEIETPRYRVFTRIASEISAAGGTFVEIAGNDDILFTAISDTEDASALASFARQGYGDQRHLRLVKVADLASALRGLGDARLEHIHDY